MLFGRNSKKKYIESTQNQSTSDYNPNEIIPDYNYGINISPMNEELSNSSLFSSDSTYIISDISNVLSSKLDSSSNPDHDVLESSSTESYEQGFSSPDADYIKAEVLEPTDNPLNQCNSVENIIKNHNQANQQAKDDRQDTKNKENKPRASVRKLIFLWATAFIAITVIVIYVFVRDAALKNNFIGKNAIEIIRDENQQKTYILDTEGNILHELDSLSSVIFYMPDHTSALLADPLGGIYFVSKNKLHSFNKNKNLYSLNISPEGYIIYSVVNDEGIHQLFQYNVTTETEEILADNKGTLQSYGYGNLSISPDGRSFSFVEGTVSNNHYNVASYISVNGEAPSLFAWDTRILFISNDGEYKYYFTENDAYNVSFYVSRKDKAVFLDNSIDQMFLNKDYSELIFTNASGSSYISTRGSTRIKLSGYRIQTLITPYRYQNSTYASGAIYPIVSFANKVILCNEGSLYWIDSDYQVKFIGKAVGKPFIYLSKDWNNLVFISEEGALVRIQDLKGDYQREVLDTSCSQLIVTEDFDEIYYLKYKADDKTISQELVFTSWQGPRKHELYYLKNGKETFLDTDVTYLGLNTDGDTALFTRNDETGRQRLYFSSQGSKSSLVKGLEDKIAYSIKPMNYGTIITDPNGLGYDIYYNIKGNEFKLILENVSRP